MSDIDNPMIRRVENMARTTPVIGLADEVQHVLEEIGSVDPDNFYPEIVACVLIAQDRIRRLLQEVTNV